MNHWYSPALLAAIGLGLLHGTAAHCADAPHEAPRLRMPDPLWSLRDMYPDIAGRSADAAARPENLPGSGQLRTPEAVPATGKEALQWTNAWQRLAEARSPGGVRLLTLWHAAAGSIALHAGRHGGPSLQWTSATSTHGTSPRGLFDHLVASGGQSQR
jgi:hypothetical protein